MIENVKVVIGVVALIVMVGAPIWLIREVKAHARKTGGKRDGDPHA